MNMKDFVYIGLIVLALVIGYITHPNGEREKISELEKDLRNKQVSLDKLRVGFDSITKVVVDKEHRIEKDSIAHYKDIAESDLTIYKLNSKIHALQNKKYTSVQLDSVVARLYGRTN